MELQLLGVPGYALHGPITTDRITAYIAHRQAEGAANASITDELAALKRAFNLATRAGRLATKPHIPRLRVDNARAGLFDAGELAKLVKELPEPLRPVVRFAWFTGWRKSEVLGLQWAQVDWEAGGGPVVAFEERRAPIIPLRRAAAPEGPPRGAAGTDACAGA